MLSLLIFAFIYVTLMLLLTGPFTYVAGVLWFRDTSLKWDSRI